MEKITEKYFLGSSKNTFILYEKRISNSKKEVFKNIGYYPNIEALCCALIDKEIKDDLGVIKNIQKIVDLIKELKEFISNLNLTSINNNN